MSRGEISYFSFFNLYANSDVEIASPGILEEGMVNISSYDSSIEMLDSP